jgi:hypothetical protein
MWPSNSRWCLRIYGRWELCTFQVSTVLSRLFFSSRIPVMHKVKDSVQLHVEHHLVGPRWNNLYRYFNLRNRRRIVEENDKKHPNVWNQCFNCKFYEQLFDLRSTPIMHLLIIEVTCSPVDRSVIVEDKMVLMKMWSEASYGRL